MRDKKDNKSTRYLLIIYIFLFLFLALASYLCYFLVVKSDKFVNNAYNPRINAMEKNVIRGEIRASDGTVLAENATNSNNELYRVYPQGKLFSHVVGYTNKGMSGIELYNNSLLLTSHEFIGDRVKNDVAGKKNYGDNLITTLDPSLQKACYDAITTEKGAAIAIEPESGKILAEVSKPSFDPNTISENWDSISNSSDSILLNRATSGLYPPGSTFKIVTALSYLRDGGSMNDTFDCHGSYTEGNYTVHCAHNESHGHQTLKMAFANSCNVAFSKIGLSLSEGILKDTAEDLMFNKKMNLDQHVSKSLFRLGDEESKSTIMATSFGQGQTLVTPMEMCMISATIANEGTMMKPYLVDSIENSNGENVKTTSPTSLKSNVLTLEEVSELKEMMRSVVTNGTARSSFRNATFEAYGKTGTAEFNAAKDTHSWFTGFATDGNKTIAVCVILEDTTSYASNSAYKIMASYFN
ncbi:MAG: penicillin-binding protein 2 [Lachnospiraceae bacterium]|nr:penicillin-binding protein 2 [Lachnospiraceae bacterium]